MFPAFPSNPVRTKSKKSSKKLTNNDISPPVIQTTEMPTEDNEISNDLVLLDA